MMAQQDPRVERRSYATPELEARTEGSLGARVQDELLWASVWLYKASKDPNYFSYMTSRDAQYGWSQKSVTETSWDDKYAGSQILLSQVHHVLVHRTAHCHRPKLQAPQNRTPWKWQDENVPPSA